MKQLYESGKFDSVAACCIAADVDHNPGLRAGRVQWDWSVVTTGRDFQLRLSRHTPTPLRLMDTAATLCCAVSCAIHTTHTQLQHCPAVTAESLRAA